MLNVTDSITFVTGYQGHGKTLFALAELDRARAEEGAHVFQMNVNEPDLAKYPALPVPLSEWTSLPNNSVVLVDEAHKKNAIPQRTKDAPPEWLMEMAEARKRGIRFIFCTQAGEDLDVFIRRRCARHIHVERKAGVEGAMLYDSPRFFDVTNPAARADTNKRPVPYPKSVFGGYKSAEEHFIKRRIPLKVWLGVALLAVALPAAIWWAVSSGSSLALSDAPLPAEAAESDSIRAGGPASGLRREAKPNPWASEAEFIKAHEPLISGVPWSAPIFAGSKPTTVPDLLCVSSQEPDGSDKRCRCYTEQGTPVAVRSPVCFLAARRGIYNPYRQPMQPPPRGEGPSPSEAGLAPAPVGVKTSPSSVGHADQGNVWGVNPNGAGGVGG